MSSQKQKKAIKKADRYNTASTLASFEGFFLRMTKKQTYWGYMVK
jgi:hypothetical protein